MTAILLGGLAVILLCVGAIAVVLLRAAADPYVPEAAEAPRPDPVDEHFASARRSVYVKSDHPEDCAEKCCWEIRLNEMVDAFDWHAYEHEMRKTK